MAPDDVPPFEAMLRIRSLRSRLDGAVLLALAAAAALPLTYKFQEALGPGFGPALIGLHLLGGALLLRAAVQRAGTLPADKRCRVTATREGVQVNGDPLPAAVVEGLFQPAPGRAGESASVRLLDANRRTVLVAEVKREDQAEALLSALGLDATHKRTEFRATASRSTTPARARTAGALAGAMVVLGAGASFLSGAAALVAVGLLTIALVAVLSLPTRVVVGVDGVLLRWLWASHFVPMSEIVSVVAQGDRSVELRSRSGQTAIRSPGRTERDAMIARITTALKAHRERPPGADLLALLARGERSREQWMAALGELREDGGYRQVVVRDEDLWRVVEDPSAPADARAAAAAVLRRSLDADGKARVRVAADATASPRLRVALESAAGASDEAVGKALDELDELRSAG
jgi:hypothetical protein